MQKIWLKDSKLSCRQNGAGEKEVKKSVELINAFKGLGP